MAYLDIISLADAKVYLRLDDDLIEDDAQITRMINGALSYVENYTNYILFARDKDFRLVDGKVRIYDYPINSYTLPIEADYDTIENKTLHTNLTDGGGNELVSINVGYASTNNIPNELLEVAYEIIGVYYFGKESGKTMADISPLNKQSLNQYKRFIL